MTTVICIGLGTYRSTTLQRQVKRKQYFCYSQKVCSTTAPNDYNKIIQLLSQLPCSKLRKYFLSNAAMTKCTVCGTREIFLPQSHQN